MNGEKVLKLMREGWQFNWSNLGPFIISPEARCMNVRIDVARSLLRKKLIKRTDNNNRVYRVSNKILNKESSKD